MNIDNKVLKKFKKTYGDIQGVHLIGNEWGNYDSRTGFESIIVVFCSASISCALFPKTYEGYRVEVREL